MDINDRLNELLSTNQAKRLADDKARDERRDNPKILRHTTYQGDRKIQQLDDDIIENGVVLNNQAVEIGDVMLPLAKGNVLRRVDNTNGGALLGSAYRKAVENDRDANGNRRNNTLGRNGGDEDPDPSNPNDPRNKPKLPPRFPPPFGCSPPPPQCIWTSDPNVPQGYQSYGSAVVNENGIELFLYCTAGTAVAPDLGCDFLSKWTCFGGVCSQNPSGIYNSRAECEAALIPPPFTGGQCAFAYIYILTRTGGGTGTFYIGLLNATNGTTTAPDPLLAVAISGARGGANSQVFKPTGITNISTVGNTTTVTVGFDLPLGTPTTQGIPLPANNGFPNYIPYTYSLKGVYPKSASDIDNCGNLPSTCPT